MVDAENRFSKRVERSYNQCHAAKEGSCWREQASKVFRRADKVLAGAASIDQELLLALADSRHDARTLAEVLSVSDYEVRARADRLIREGLLVKRGIAYGLSPATQLYVSRGLSSASSRAS